MAGIDLRLGCEGHHALEAPLHLLAVATGKVPAAGASLKEDVAREQHPVALEVKAGRPFGMPRRVQGGDPQIGDVAECAFIEEIVRVAWRDLESRRRTL